VQERHDGAGVAVGVAREFVGHDTNEIDST
jgi:hypothetical protein